MKKLIVKYSIEFFVIVFSISVSFFVENLRVENENENQRRLIKQSLLQELKSGDEFLKFRKNAFEMDLKAIKLILKDDSPLDSIFSNISKSGFSNPFIIPRNFNPPSSVYNSLVNDGTINLIKSQEVKSLIEDTYVFWTKKIQGWGAGEGLIAEKIEFYIMENYSEFYLKDIFTTTDKAIMLEFKSIVQNDPKLKAYLKAKTGPMIVKLNSLQNYTDSRESLISALEESLK
ncbi:hypothetical protein N8301_04830 [Cyclobacteriaceae bacterium]|nr:hypothetical protein [Cyclobacteriaceae bacterium]